MSEADFSTGCGIQHRPPFARHFARCEGETLCRDCAEGNRRANFVLTVAKAALDDTAEARERFGRESAEYERQVNFSLGLIRGSLETLLSAAIPPLEERLRERQRPPTQIE